MMNRRFRFWVLATSVQLWVILYATGVIRGKEKDGTLCQNKGKPLTGVSSFSLHTRLPPRRRRFYSSSSSLNEKEKKYKPPFKYPLVDYKVASQLARAFPKYPHKFPCFPPEEDWKDIQVQRRPTKRGFFYFKARKAGSSTLAGVALRIAQRQQQRETNAINNNNNNNTDPAAVHTDTHCHTRYGHPAAHRLKYYERIRSESFLWSVIREPTSRQLSEFVHFGVSRMKAEPTKGHLQWYIEETPLVHSYYLQFMSTDKAFQHNNNNDNVIAVVQRVLNDYDFIGITERMMESLVCLQLILGLTTGDLLFLKAKTQGGFDDGVFQEQCSYIQPSYQSPAMLDYLQSPEWHNFTRHDNLFYVAVNASLDKTIQALGRQKVDQQVQRLQWALSKVQERCANKVVFPCSSGGVFSANNDCVLWDSGCGYKCIDAVSDELGL